MSKVRGHAGLTLLVLVCPSLAPATGTLDMEGVLERAAARGLRAEIGPGGVVQLKAGSSGHSNHYQCCVGRRFRVYITGRDWAPAFIWNGKKPPSFPTGFLPELFGALADEMGLVLDFLTMDNDLSFLFDVGSSADAMPFPTSRLQFLQVMVTTGTPIPTAGCELDSRLCEEQRWHPLDLTETVKVYRDSYGVLLRKIRVKDSAWCAVRRSVCLMCMSDRA